jgi:hypothetical protein
MPIPPSINKVLSNDAGNIASYPGTGTLWTDTSGAVDLTLINSPTYVSDIGYFNFSGANRSAEGTGFPPITVTGPFSFNTWFKIDGVLGNTFMLIWATGVGGPGVSTSCGWTFLEYAGNLAMFAKGAAFYANVGTYTIGKWHQFTCTVNASGDTKCYIDGVLSFSQAAGVWGSGSPAGSTNQVGGLSTDATLRLDGSVALIETYDLELTSGQVNEIYTSYYQRFHPPYPPKTIDFNFDDPACYPGSGTVVTDLAGNLDLAFVGTPTFASSAGNGSYFSFDKLTLTSNHLASSFSGLLNGTFNFSYSFCIRPKNFNASENNFYGGINSSTLAYADGASIARLAPSSEWYVEVGTNGSATSGAATDNNWYVVTVTADFTNNQLKKYVNGVLLSTNSLTSVTYTNAQVILGFLNAVPYRLNDKGDSDIKAFSLWKNVVLNPDQVNSVASDFVLYLYPPTMDLNASISASASGSGATWYDLTTNNFDFTMYNPSFTASIGGTIPGYFSFPSRNFSDALTVYGEYNGTPAVNQTSNFTGHFWVKRNANHGSFNQNRVSILANGREDNITIYNGWSYGANNNPSAANDNIVLEASTVGISDSGVSIQDAEWVCVSYIYNPGIIYFYINGSLVDSNSFSTPVTPTTGMWISRTAGSLFSWMGDITIARQWNTNLSNVIIKQLYEYDLNNFIDPIIPTPPAPVSYVGLIGGRTFGQGFAG